MIVAIKGGLGNQLFQAAFALMLKNRLRQEVKVDDRDFPNKGREFMLDRIGMSLPHASEEEIFADRWGRSFVASKASHWIRKATGVGRKEPGVYSEKQRWSYDPAVFAQPGKTYFSGYWMSCRYHDIGCSWEEAFPFLQGKWPGEFEAMAAEMMSSESVAVHIRRGDYANVESVRATYLVCTPAYFERAMKRCVKELDTPRFYLFSDDEEYVRSLDWGGLDVVVVPAAPQVGDEHHLRLMAACRHQVISNSTFSWWAAYLNQNPGKRVFCPDRWQASVDSRDLVGEFIPQDWELVRTAD